MSWTTRLATLQDLARMGWDLGLLRYPAFVYGRAPRAGEAPPVLCLHTGLAEPFERWCRHLAESGIVTLDAEQYLRRVTGEQPSGEREVFLTFDDGHLSVWSVIEPLLHRYGLRATTFLIPGRMRKPHDGAGESLRPTLEDVWAGSIELQALEATVTDGYTLANWAENRRMHERGAIDFQAHTHRHALIAVSDRIVGFVTPQLRDGAHPFELAMLAPPSDGVPVGDVAVPPLGTPIYASASRMAAQRACFPESAVLHACAERVADAGGADFFDTDGWERQLRNLASEHHRPPRYESAVEQRAAILDDLIACRTTIESSLPGASVTHLAWPWGVGAEVSTGAAREAGYRSVHWGRVDARLSNRVGTDPLRLARIGEDFFDLLPGVRRATLSGILTGKLTRRLRAGSPYVGH